MGITNNMINDDEKFAVESGAQIILQMSFGTTVYRQVFTPFAIGLGLQIYSRKKETYYDAINGITPTTKCEVRDYDNVSRENDQLYSLLRVLRTNGYKVISPRKTK